MKLWRAFSVTLMVAFCAATLQAGPHVIIHDPKAPLSTPVGLTFTFDSDNSGGGVLAFTNASGVYWYNLYVFTPAPEPVAPISCGGDSFAFCFILPGQFGYYATVAFTGLPGITNTQLFFADLGTGGWTPNAQFLAIANYAPEPGTLLLAASGIVSLIARRKLFGRVSAG